MSINSTAAPAGPATAGTTGAMTTTDAARPVLAQFLDAWLARDLARLGELITDDCVYSVTTGPEPGTSYTGRTAVLEGFAQMLPTDGDGIRFGEIFSDGDRAGVEWSVGGEGTSLPLMRGCDVFTLAGDRIARKEAYRKVVND